MPDSTETAADIDERLAADMRATAHLLDARDHRLTGELADAGGLLRDALDRRLVGRG